MPMNGRLYTLSDIASCREDLSKEQTYLIMSVFPHAEVERESDSRNLEPLYRAKSAFSELGQV